jgi:hypothetical protein
MQLSISGLICMAGCQNINTEPIPMAISIRKKVKKYFAIRLLLG